MWIATLKIQIKEHVDGTLGLVAKDMRPLLSFALFRQRQDTEITIKEAANNLGSNYPNAYAKYEKGSINISLNQYSKLMQAVNPQKSLVLSFS